MPRQIIDTESSRPAYRRRLVLQVLGVVVLLLIVAALVLFALHAHGFKGPGAIGNWQSGGGTTLVTLPRSIDAA